MSIFTKLLGRGYFPRELPITFTTSDLSNNAESLILEWEKKGLFSQKIIKMKDSNGNKFKLSNSYEYSLSDTEPEFLSKPKRGYERRNISITHPIPQTLLAHEISKNWKKISKFLCQQSFSLDKIRFDPKNERAIDSINFRQHEEKKNFIKAANDYAAITDVKHFYPSIYTHSLSWASYGKENVKNSLNLYKGSLMDRLDILVRKCNRNQTIGIPIGPDTSRILADIISTRIELDYSKSYKGETEQIDRLQDDWLIGANSLEEAETRLTNLNKAYRNFGLEINGTKTSLNHISTNHEPDWIAEIRAFLIHCSFKLTGKTLEEFLKLCLKVQSSNPYSSAINYAMSIISSTQIRESDFSALESFLLTAAVVSPISMDNICRTIINFARTNNNFSGRRIANRFSDLLINNLSKGNDFEALWQIYTLRGIRAPLIVKQISELLESRHGSSIELILLNMKQTNLLIGQLPIDGWELLTKNEENAYNPNWMLLYEGIRKGWLIDRGNILRTRFFNSLNSRNINYYDETKNVQTLSALSSNKKILRKAQARDSEKTLNMLRHITSNFGY